MSPTREHAAGAVSRAAAALFEGKKGEDAKGEGGQRGRSPARAQLESSGVALKAAQSLQHEAADRTHSRPPSRQNDAHDLVTSGVFIRAAESFGQSTQVERGRGPALGPCVQHCIALIRILCSLSTEITKQAQKS